jgi:hypothetical protein
MEIDVTDGTAAESIFMQRILGESEYNYNLGANFSQMYECFALKTFLGAPAS